MSKRYGVVLTYDGRMSIEYAGRFRHLKAALKERDRQNRTAWFRVQTHDDLLRRASFKYYWRVWDHWNRRFAD